MVCSVVCTLVALFSVTGDIVCWFFFCCSLWFLIGGNDSTAWMDIVVEVVEVLRALFSVNEFNKVVEPICVVVQFKYQIVLRVLNLGAEMSHPSLVGLGFIIIPLELFPVCIAVSHEQVKRDVSPGVKENVGSQKLLFCNWAIEISRFLPDFPEDQMAIVTNLGPGFLVGHCDIHCILFKVTLNDAKIQCCILIEDGVGKNLPAVL